MEKLFVICVVACAVLANFVSGKAAPGRQIAIDAPMSSDAICHTAAKVPPGAHGRSKRAATCGTQTTLRSIQAQESVMAHNMFRAKEGSSNMVHQVWSDELAAVAQAWANTCTWEHGMLYDCNGNRMGQNLFVESSTGGYPALNITGVIDAWCGEKKDYNAVTGQCNSGKMCGHYTQVVAARSREVGCGATQCPALMVGSQKWTNALLVVCNYRRPGNVIGEQMYSKGSACTNCDSDATGTGYKCVNNLCSLCSPATDSSCKCGQPVACENGGTWSTTTCSCTCPKKYYGAKCELTCTCADISPEDCADWADYCKDEDYSEFMQENCKTTCKAYLGPCVLPASCSA